MKNTTSKNQDGVYQRDYLNSHLALYDVIFSLHQFLSHKEKIGIIRRGSSVCEMMIAQFLKQQVPIQYKDDKQNTFEYIETIDRETNFVIWASENEITGENIFSDKDCVEIHEKLSAKRIFSIQLMSASRPIPKSEIFKHQYAVIVETADLFSRKRSSVFFSEKFKAPSLIGPLQYLKFAADFEKIERKQWPDRRFFHFPNISGHALKQTLLQSLGLNPELFFAPAEMPSWVTESWKNWWSEAGHSEFLRGVLVVTTSAFQQMRDLEAKINEAAQQLETKSNWSIK